MSRLDQYGYVRRPQIMGKRLECSFRTVITPPEILVTQEIYDSVMNEKGSDIIEINGECFQFKVNKLT